jgi:hypothetical protein
MVAAIDAIGRREIACAADPFRLDWSDSPRARHRRDVLQSTASWRAALAIASSLAILPT